MRQVYFQSPSGNFGDDVNSWFWDEVLPGWRDWDDSVTLVGIGTILNAGLLPDGRKLVIGSGVGYGRQPDVSDADLWDIRAVRGPKTAYALGLDRSRVISDPAIFLPRLSRFYGIEKSNDVVFVPHVGSDKLYDWQIICESIGLVYQSPSSCPDQVITRLASARAVIAESMHAAIIADAFRTHWTGVSISRGFNKFKWQDWASSVGINNVKLYNFFPMLKAMIELKARANIRKSTQKNSQSLGASFSNELRVKPRLVRDLARHHLRTAYKQGGFMLSDEVCLSKAQDAYERLFAKISNDYT